MNPLGSGFKIRFRDKLRESERKNNDTQKEKHGERKEKMVPFFG